MKKSHLIIGGAGALLLAAGITLGAVAATPPAELKPQSATVIEDAQALEPSPAPSATIVETEPVAVEDTVVEAPPTPEPTVAPEPPAPVRIERLTVPSGQPVPFQDGFFDTSLCQSSTGYSYADGTFLCYG